MSILDQRNVAPFYASFAFNLVQHVARLAAHISTSPVASHEVRMPMLWFGRLMNVFSNIDAHIQGLSLYFVFYNFSPHPLHAAGHASDRLWRL